MASVKASLKAAKSALDARDYDKALSEARTVLDLDPQNYFGQVFVGRALEKKGNIDSAIEAYKAATKKKPNDELAWKGLCTVYEAQKSQGVSGHTESAVELAVLYAEKDERDQCLAITEKLVSFAKEFGTSSQYMAALEAYLPSSPIFDFLEGLIPHPANTFVKLAEILQSQEKDMINKEVGERRTRLGANRNQVAIDVAREVYDKSKLEDIYQNIINWTRDDELRWLYEEKLLERAYNHLLVLPSESKRDKSEQVWKLVTDMITVKHPFKLAWDLNLELRAVEDLQDLDKDVLLEYINFFPDSGLGKAIQGLLGVSPKKKSEPADVDGEKVDDSTNDGGKRPDRPVEMTSEERLLLMTDGLDEARSSSFAYRVMGSYYLQIEEYEGCTEACREAKRLLEAAALLTGYDLRKNVNAVKTMLGTSLVYYQSPKNHPEAQSLFDDVLRDNPNETSALLGVGLINEEQDDYKSALEFLNRAMARDPDNPIIGAEAAWCKAMTGMVEEGTEELQRYLELMPKDNKGRLIRAQTHYRIGKCLWILHPDIESRQDRTGPYASFLSALKLHPDFAPAYSALGIFYADYAEDKKRSRLCFQRAIELSATEIESAERLANIYADEKEWDIVEAIAKRVIDSGVAKPSPGSKKKGVSWPFAALGVVQINRQDYPSSVTSFQSALRLSPRDYNSWVGLGESYHSSGRYIAARRALEHANLLKKSGDTSTSGDSWLAEYMLANVMRELGGYEEAVSGYRNVLSVRHAEFGVSIALLQTLIEQSWARIEQGFFRLATESARQSLLLAEEMLKVKQTTFNFWKAIGDACSIYSWLPSQLESFPTEKVTAIMKSVSVTKLEDPDAVDQAGTELGKLNLEDQQIHEKAGILQVLSFAVQSYKEGIKQSSTDKHAQAVSWYNLGWAFHRAFTCVLEEQPGNAKRFEKSAVRCFKRAIELESGNADFWNALGVATTNLNSRVAQHSFIRSLHLNERNARTWVNLGVFYLIQEDIELAHKAFARAQSVDPDFAYAWIGEGIVALLVGEKVEALSHFTHAYEISDALLAPIKKYFVTASFDHIKLSTRLSSDVFSNVLNPLFAIRQLRNQQNQNPALEHLAALFQERSGDYETAKSTLEVVCANADARYENSEDQLHLVQYIRAKSDLARMQIATEDFASAAENAETVLDLSTEQDESPQPVEEHQTMRLCAHLVGGLAYHRLGKIEQALESFRAALEESKGSPDVICLLAQVLWSKGGEAEKDVAKDQLFDCIEKHPNHLQTKTLLGAMSASDTDESIKEAVDFDLKAMRGNTNLTLSQEGQIDKLLIDLASLKGRENAESDKLSLTEAQIVTMMSPSQPQGWSGISESEADYYPCDMYLKTTTRATPPHGFMDSEEIARASAESGSVQNAQTSIALCPWLIDGWRSLKECIL